MFYDIWQLGFEAFFFAVSDICHKRTCTCTSVAQQQTGLGELQLFVRHCIIEMDEIVVQAFMGRTQEWGVQELKDFW